MLKPKVPGTAKLVSAFHKPALPKSIPANIPDHKRPDLSTVVIEPYEPDADEQHITDIRDELLQDEHPSPWYIYIYIYVFSKLLSTILRHELKNYEQKLDPVDKDD